MRLSLQPLVDALRQHVGGGFAHAFVKATGPKSLNVHELPAATIGDALLTALLGGEELCAPTLGDIYFMRDGRVLRAQPANLKAETIAAFPESLSIALATALMEDEGVLGQQATLSTISVVAVSFEGGLAGAVVIEVQTSDGPFPVVLSYGDASASPPMSRASSISGAALRAAGQQARLTAHRSRDHSLTLAAPAASGALN